MRYVILLTLDAASTAAIERAERDIAAVHARHRPFDSRVQPHVTLGAWEQIDPSRSDSLLAAYAADVGVMPLRIASLGVFTGDAATVFAAPVVTERLLTSHARLHRQVSAITSEPVPHYRPGNWVPHCTLAERIHQSSLPAVLAAAYATPLPIIGRFGAVQLVEFPASRILQSAPLHR